MKKRLIIALAAIFFFALDASASSSLHYWSEEENKIMEKFAAAPSLAEDYIFAATLDNTELRKRINASHGWIKGMIEGEKFIIFVFASSENKGAFKDHLFLLYPLKSLVNLSDDDFQLEARKARAQIVGVINGHLAKTVTDKEKSMINIWLRSENLDKYGNKQGTKYKNGTPLFSEKLDLEIDRYVYLFGIFHWQPWLK